MCILLGIQHSKLKSQSPGYCFYAKSKSPSTFQAHLDTKGRHQHSVFSSTRQLEKEKNLYQFACGGDRHDSHTGAHKLKLAHDHYSQLLGTTKARTKALNWDALNYVRQDLDELDAPFYEQEIEMVIKDLPSEKAPGPDGFIGIFYKKCWSIIKEDLV